MEEKVTLALEVETSGVKQGASELDKLAQAGARAEKSTSAMSDSAARANAQIAAMAQKAGNASGAFKPLDPASVSLSKIASEAQKANAQLSGIGSQTNKFEQIAKSADSASVGINKAAQSLDKFQKEAASIQGIAGSLSAGFSSLAKIAGGLFAGVSIAAFAGKLISVQREFDVLNSSLITITGSSANAEKELSWIKEFAAETPYSLAEVTQAFIKMKSLGLDASKESLTSYGNTASAMGKSLNQMIEAVADASTGEFERLKEFGIKAKQNGDQVSLTFQGVTTTIKNNAESISQYLTAIGDKNFFGAMAERAKTLDGAISNLGDTWDELFRTINQNNTGGIIYDSVKLATGAIGDLISVIRAMNSAYAEGTQESGAFASIQGGISSALDAVAIVATRVKFGITAIGKELGALAAQAVAVSQLQFSQAATIGNLRREDAKQEAANQDKALRAIANRAQADSDRKGIAALTDIFPSEKPKQSAGLGGGKKGGGRSIAAQASEEAKAYEQAMKSFSDIARDADKSTLDLSGSQQKLYDLMTSANWAKMPDVWKQTALAQFESARAAELNAKFMKDVEAQQQKNLNARQSMIEQIQKAQDDTDKYGLTAAQISVVEQARLADAVATLEQASAAATLAGASETEQQNMQAQIAFLREELQLRGKLSDTLSAKEAKQYDIQDAAKSVEEKSGELGEFLKQAAKNSQDAMAEFFINPTKDGMSSIGESFYKTLQKMIAQAGSAQLLKLMLGDVDKTGNIGGLLGSVLGSGGKSSSGSSGGGLGSLISGLFGGGSTASTGTAFSAADLAWLESPMFHNGGIVGAGNTASKMVPASLFNNAPRYHSGGIVGDEVPAILKKGERVLTKEQQQGMGNVVINISSSNGDPAEIRRAAAAGARTALGAMNGARRYG